MTKVTPPPAVLPNIGKPATRALAGAGVSNLDQVARMTERQLSALHGVGPKAIGILKAALQSRGQALAEDRKAK